MRMRVIFFIIMFFTILLSENQKSKFKIDGMMCETGCTWKVESVVKPIEGINIFHIRANIFCGEKLCKQACMPKNVRLKVFLGQISASEICPDGQNWPDDIPKLTRQGLFLWLGRTTRTPLNPLLSGRNYLPNYFP